MIGLEHGACLVVVENERPEVLGGNVRRQVNLVGLAPVEGIALGINVGAGVLRTFPDHFRGHRGRDPGGIEEEARVSVEEAHAVLLEFITAAYEGRAPALFG